jgi:hypothetical protein
MKRETAKTYPIINSMLLMILLWLLFIPKPLMAQYFSIGTDPASVHWEVIETTHYKVIFPKEYRNNAQETVRNLEYLHPKIGMSLNMSPRKTTLIIHNRTVASNGVTTLTPKRIELFTAQSPTGYAQPWMDQLILHEMRHICQMDKLNSSSLRYLYYLFGDQIVGAVIGLNIPQWYLEGDAVLSETTLSNSGRGRTPIFTAELRSTLLNRGPDSYSKSMFGSYKESVADHYQQGFYLVKTATQQFGADFWANNIKQTAEIPIISSPFKRSFKKQAGIRISKYYEQTIKQLEKTEKQRIANTTINEHHPLVSDTNQFADYESMAVVDDSSIIATKRQLHKTTRILVIRNGKQQVIEENSLIVKGSLTIEKNIVCWAERRKHPRWNQSSWFALVTYNLTTKKRNVILKNCRLHAPNISHHADKIVAVEQNTTDTNSLIIYSSEGKLLQKIAPPEQCTIMQPRWCENDTAVVAILLNRKGKQLVRYSFADKQWQKIAIPSYRDFQLWQIIGDSALITVSRNDNTPVCKTSLIDGGCNIAVTLPFDISSAMATHNGKIVCLQTTGLGLKPFSATPTTTSFNLFTAHMVDEFSFLNKSDVPIQFDLAPDTVYLVKPYRRINHLFNIHSWGPISVNSSSGTANPGLSLSSQNDLSTSIFETGMSYSNAEKSTTYYSMYSYDGWFAQMNASYETKMTGSDAEHSSYQQSEAKVGVRIPLVFEQRNYVIPITFNAIASSIEFSNHNGYIGNINALQLRFFQSIVKRSPTQALLPPLGYSVELNYKTDLKGTLNAGSIGAIEGVVYLPSLFKNHGFMISGGYQQIIPKQFSYGMMLQYPRGYIGVVKSNALATSINYQFPLCYPDWSLGSILYLKRVKVALFHDYMKFEKPQKLTQFQSLGAEMIAECYWFRFIAPISIGGRTTYIPAEKKVLPELIFGINFNNL